MTDESDDENGGCGVLMIIGLVLIIIYLLVTTSNLSVRIQLLEDRLNSKQER